MNYIKELINLYIDRRDFFTPLFIKHLKISFMALIIVVVLGITISILISRNETFAKIILLIVIF